MLQMKPGRYAVYILETESREKSIGRAFLGMTTPSMAFSICLRNALLAFWAAWGVAFITTRVYSLHEAYIEELGRRNDEKWLLAQCQYPEFYSNLRQHSDLCTEVGCPNLIVALDRICFISTHISNPPNHLRWSLLEASNPRAMGQVSNNARANLLLRALSRVMEQSMHLCGSMSCMDAAYSLAFRMGWHAVVLGAVLLVAAPNLLLILVQSLCHRKRTESMEQQLVSSWVAGHDRFCHPAYPDAADWMKMNKSPSPWMLAQKKEMMDEQYNQPSMKFRRAVFFNRPLAPAPHDSRMQILGPDHHGGGNQGCVPEARSANTIQLV